MLLSQNLRKNDPLIAKMMAMEGLNEWKRFDAEAEKGYEELYKAMKEQNLLGIVL